MLLAFSNVNNALETVVYLNIKSAVTEGLSGGSVRLGNFYLELALVIHCDTAFSPIIQA